MTHPTTILLTGATSGLGRALTDRLADRDIRLILHGRSAQRLAALRADLTDAPAEIITVQADLAELAQVQQLADAVRRYTQHVSVLVNNAGIGKGATDTREVSADGSELRLAVNHLAPFALTHQLLPLLAAGAPSRVVNVASGAQQPLDFTDPHLEHDYTGDRAYACSKFALVAAGFALAKQLGADITTVNSLHPATLMPTRMVHEGYGRTVDDLDTGVQAVLRLMDDPDLAGVTGQYFSIQQRATAHPETYDDAVQQQVWELSRRLTRTGAA